MLEVLLMSARSHDKILAIMAFHALTSLFSVIKSETARDQELHKDERLLIIDHIFPVAIEGIDS